MKNLVEKDVFPIDSIGGEIFKDPFRTDSMFSTQFLPKLEADYVRRPRNEND